MKITEVEIGKHYLLDEPEGNDVQTEVYLKKIRKSILGNVYTLHFVKDDETLEIYPPMAEAMNFHEIKR